MKEIIVQLLWEAAAFVGLFIAGCVLVVVMTSKQIKTWIKTTVYFLVSEGIAAFIGWLAWKCYCSGNYSATIISGSTALILALAFLCGGIKGHKQDWKHIENVI